MTETLQTTMSSKGQVVIAKEIRDKLDVKQNQRLIQKIEGGRIILVPVKRLSELGGIWKGKTKKSIKQIMKEIDEGWE